MASSTHFDPKWKIARSFPRFEIELPVTILGLGMDTSSLPAKMVDVGLGGSCIVIEDAQLVPRQKVLLEFRFPMSLSPLRVKAMVRHRNAPRYGFQFMDLEPEDREKIRRACSSLKII